MFFILVHWAYRFKFGTIIKVKRRIHLNINISAEIKWCRHSASCCIATCQALRFFYSHTQRDEIGVVTRVEGVDRGGGRAPPPSASWAKIPSLLNARGKRGVTCLCTLNSVVESIYCFVRPRETAWVPQSKGPACISCMIMVMTVNWVQTL